MLEEWLNLHKIEKQMNQDLNDVLKNMTTPTELNEFCVLYVLSKYKKSSPLTISDISDKIGLSISATSRMLNRFINNCHVLEREKNPEDGRGTNIKLTPQGEQLLLEGQKAIEPILIQYKKKLKDLIN